MEKEKLLESIKSLVNSISEYSESIGELAKDQLNLFLMTDASIEDLKLLKKDFEGVNAVFKTKAIA